jgi:tetratricopeptide (TPR) repeat protein
MLATIARLLRRSRLFQDEKAREVHMRLRHVLPRAGVIAVAFAGLGTGVAIAFVTHGSVQPPRAANVRSPDDLGIAHCIFAAVAPQLQPAEPAKAYEEAEPPLWNDLGSLSYPISTTNSEAQAYFNQGLRLAANFNHAEAQRAFRKAQRLDPNCALCFLGEALVLGPNINVPMSPDANAPAIAALRKAQALAAGASTKERGLIQAVAARYSDDPNAERPKLDAAFADAMMALSDKYPDDLELAVLAAEAEMDTQPWDYWQPGGKEPKGRAADIQKRLEGVLAKSPNHPWAIHLYIHLVEASDRPERAESYADRLAALMPGAGHIVHMPSHIYYRIGRYADSMQTNKAASKVDEQYITQTGAVGVYPIGYYSHNLHFVLVSAQLLGDRKTVLEQADKLDKWLSNEVATAIPIAQPVKAAPYFAWAQYADPDKILAMPDPAGAPPYVKAMWHYARGVAYAAKKDVAAARGEASAIQRIATETDWSVLDAWGIPAVPVTEVAANIVRARAAQAEGDQNAAVDALRKAADVQDTIPYMEPPFWYYPVRQSLGAALLKTGHPDEAEKEFNTASERERSSAWILYGLKEAAKARGDRAAEQRASEELAKAWHGDPGMLTLERL